MQVEVASGSPAPHSPRAIAVLHIKVGSHRRRVSTQNGGRVVRGRSEQPPRALLHAQPAPLLRNEVPPERVLVVSMLILREGDPGEPAVTVSPLRYRDQHMTEIDAVVPDVNRDAGSMRSPVTSAQALSADRTLGGLCDWNEAEAPRAVDLPVWCAGWSMRARPMAAQRPAAWPQP